MKTKIIIAVIAIVAVVSLGASKVAKNHTQVASSEQSSPGTLGGLAAEEK